MKILITGGHVTPAVAVIDELKGQEIVFVGRKYATSKEETPSFEYKEITERGIKFIDLSTGRFTRALSLSSFINLLKTPKGIINAYRILKKEKPDRVLSFGGYLALPIALWTYFLRIPVFTQEQTIVPGLANKLIGKFAKKILVSFEDAAAFFPKNKVLVSGNPVRESIFKVIKKPFVISDVLPTIFVSGGSLGSHSINKHVKNILQELLKKYQLIHQTGSVKGDDDYDSLLKIREALPSELRTRYFLKEHFFEEEFGFIYSVSTMVVGRAGANTFFELIALEKPAVFIPLPWSSGKEQQKHAQIFKDAGCGEVFDQFEESQVLYEKIKKVFNNLEEYKNNFRNLKYLNSQNAAGFIAQEILKT